MDRSQETGKEKGMGRGGRLWGYGEVDRRGRDGGEAVLRVGAKF